MKGLFVQSAENSEAERLVRLGITFLLGMFVVYGFKGVWAQKKGRWRTSENISLQEIVGGLEDGRAR